MPNCFKLVLALLCCCCLQAALRGAQHMEVPMQVSNDFAGDDPLYMVHFVVDGQSTNAIVDTGSTGLIVANKNAIRKTQSCASAPKQCSFQTSWRLNYLACYKDGIYFCYKCYDFDFMIKQLGFIDISTVVDCTFFFFFFLFFSRSFNFLLSLEELALKDLHWQ